jgi:acyl-CoA synthetase (AMP-forming)/AMP-acid ligase II
MMELLTGLAGRCGAIADADGRTPFTELAQRARRMAGCLARDHGAGPGSFIYFLAPESAGLVAAVAAADLLGATACVLNPLSSPDELSSLFARLPPGLLISKRGSGIALDSLESSGAEPSQSAVRGRIMILTTGTTGVPKPVLYEWSRLASQVRHGAAPGVWALLYPLNHFAGIQVLLHALKSGSVLAIPKSRSFPDVWNCLIEHQVDSASASPTFWRTFAGRLDGAAAARLHLRQITLGGEPATADILERLRQLFPAARISHVYATTELGSCFAVHDGLPGFPAVFLERPCGNVELKIHDGELFVRTAFGMERYADGSPAPPRAGDWIATGDCVERTGDRVYFRGRVSEIINVGGVKVSPPLVEQEIRKAPGVREARVFGKSNPVTGQIVAAEIEIAQGANGESVLAAIRQACRARLNRYEQPREIHIVDALERRNEKLARRSP